jgi:hypothetical protein
VSLAPPGGAVTLPDPGAATTARSALTPSAGPPPGSAGSLARPGQNARPFGVRGAAGTIRLTVDDHLFIAAERAFELCVLRLDQENGAVYAPHTSKGFVAPPNKNLLLVLNGLLAKFGLWQARRHGTAERLERLATEKAAAGTTG